MHDLVPSKVVKSNHLQPDCTPAERKDETLLANKWETLADFSARPAGSPTTASGMPI
jgi:hypothetical protein